MVFFIGLVAVVQVLLIIYIYIILRGGVFISTFRKAFCLCGLLLVSSGFLVATGFHELPGGSFVSISANLLPLFGFCVVWTVVFMGRRFGIGFFRFLIWIFLMASLLGVSMVVADVVIFSVSVRSRGVLLGW